MHIEKIYIEDNFVPDIVQDQYRRKRIGVGLSIKEGESATDAIKTAEQFIADYIKANTIYPERNHIEERIIPEHLLPEIQVKEETLHGDDLLLSEINSCKELNVLLIYKYLAKGNPLLREAYDKKVEQLNIKNIIND